MIGADRVLATTLLCCTGTSSSIWSIPCPNLQIHRAEINRDINGVVMAAQNDEQGIEQVLSEHIIIRELRRHFDMFLNNGEKSLNARPTKTMCGFRRLSAMQ